MYFHSHNHVSFPTRSSGGLVSTHELLLVLESSDPATVLLAMQMIMHVSHVDHEALDRQVVTSCVFDLDVVGGVVKLLGGQL